MKSPAIGILGVGWVGQQLKKYFEELKGYQAGNNLLLYDIKPEKCAGNINNAEIIFVTLPTPRNPKDGSCDLSIIEGAIAKISEEKIIVLKSTVPPGTTEAFQEKYPQHKFLFNPEFLTESRAWEDMIRPDRQIVGFTEKSLEAAYLVLSLLPKAPFMSPWGLNTYSRVRINATEAELIKYAGNIHFVRKVNWANALSKISEKIGADYENVRQGMAADHRIGDSHLDVNHGGYRGWGGACFPKDLDAFIQFTKNAGVNEVTNLLQEDHDFNENLLKTQGLTLEEVSQHIDTLEKKLKKKK
ncbi:MAG: UDP-glucose/GDP-mannose dehydrogenase family protein [Candidatus Harrisonbacteria bacterium]|nr:UDP-glucose/GDP-mannose dehydrogenase family protein [Candidatus Harrisonbacteria bacterium]